MQAIAIEPVVELTVIAVRTRFNTEIMYDYVYFIKA
jgi:hypothetical protein